MKIHFGIFYFIAGIFFGMGLALQFANQGEAWVLLCLLAVLAVVACTAAEVGQSNGWK